MLVVLLMLGTIAAFAAVVSRSVSGAAVEMGTAMQIARQEWDLRAGIELGVAAIYKLGKEMRRAQASVNLNDRRIHVRVTNERARIDLNAANRAILSNLLKAQGVIDGEAAALAESVVEWRGGSASQRLAAPSDDEWQLSDFARSGTTDLQPHTELRKAPQQNVGTRFFLHPVQLASVPGFSKALVARLLPVITVANGTGQVDPYLAPRAVLMALPDVSEATVDAFVSAREGNSGRDLAIKLLGVAEAIVTSAAGVGWRIEITSAERGGRTYRSEAVVAVLDGDTEPYRVLYVRDAQ